MFGSKENLEAAILSLPMELERMTNELRAGLGSYKDGQRLEGHRAIDPARANPVHSGSGRLLGWSLRAEGGPVSLTLRDGRDDSADAIAVVELAAGTTSTHAIALPGVSITETLWATRTGAGKLVGALYLGAVD